MPFTQIPRVLTFYHICFLSLSHTYIYIFLHHVMAQCKLMPPKKCLHVFPKNKTSLIDTHTRFNKIRKLAMILLYYSIYRIYFISPVVSLLLF